MDNVSIGTISLLSSNILLSSYPILVKSYINDISVLVQMIIRVIVYICLALPFLLLNGEGISIITNLINPKYIAISAVNLLHIYSSYKGFEYLNAGISLTTFYTYPIIQVLLSRLFLGTELTRQVIYSLFGCLIGIFVLNKDSYTDVNKNAKKGFLFIGLAALTEAIIDLFYKSADLKNPFMSLYTLYAPAFSIFLIIYLFLNYKQNNILSNFTINSGNIKKIILYNLLIGGLGYTLRLFSLTKISITWFSALSFTSSISAFLMGWLFLGEKIKLHHFIGSAIIFYNVYRISIN